MERSEQTKSLERQLRAIAQELSTLRAAITSLKREEEFATVIDGQQSGRIESPDLLLAEPQHPEESCDGGVHAIQAAAPESTDCNGAVRKNVPHTAGRASGAVSRKLGVAVQGESSRQLQVALTEERISSLLKLQGEMETRLRELGGGEGRDEGGQGSQASKDKGSLAGKRKGGSAVGDRGGEGGKNKASQRGSGLLMDGGDEFDIALDAAAAASSGKLVETVRE